MYRFFFTKLTKNERNFHFKISISHFNFFYFHDEFFFFKFKLLKIFIYSRLKIETQFFELERNLELNFWIGTKFGIKFLNWSKILNIIFELEQNLEIIVEITWKICGVFDEPFSTKKKSVNVHIITLYDQGERISSVWRIFRF